MSVVNSLSTVVASAARTTSGSAVLSDLHRAESVDLTLDVTAQSGTTPTLDVLVTYVDPASGKSITVGTFTQVGAATGTETIALSPVPPDVTIAWTLAGTSPNYTFSIGARIKSDLPRHLQPAN